MMRNTHEVQTLIGSQAKHEIKSSIEMRHFWKGFCFDFFYKNASQFRAKYTN